MINCIEQESLSIRRSIYQLGKTPIVSDYCIINTAKTCLKHCPTAFNSQSARLVLLFEKYHMQFWNMVWEKLQKIINKAQYDNTKNRIKGFSNAYGTILFFEDLDVIKNLEKNFSLYAHNFHDWSLQSNGMLQYMIWQTLAENDEGASLQHYNELIESEVYLMYDIPQTWKLVAQMPWGSIEKEPLQKTFLPLDERIKVFK